VPGDVQALAAATTGTRMPGMTAHRLCAHTLGNPRHVLALLAAMLCWSTGTLASRAAVSAAQVSAGTCVQMLVGATLLSLMALVHGDWHALHPSQVSLASWLALAYLTVFGSIVALSCFLWLLTQVSPHKATSYALVNPLVALILGAVLLGEKITPSVALAVLLILMGVALVLFRGESRT